MFLIAIKQNYDLFKEEKDSNDFKSLSNYRVMRAVIQNTDGGEHKEEVAYIKNKYKDNLLFQQLLEVGRNLKIHNLSMLINEVKGNFKSFFTKIKAGDQKAKPPKPKKLSKLHKFTVRLDFNSWSLKKHDHIGINLGNKMSYLYLPHQKLKELICSLENVQAVAIQLSNGDIYLKISYRYTLSQQEQTTTKEAGLDLGVNNLAALFINDETSKSMIIDGTAMKHYNSSFNRFLAKLNNSIDKLRDELKDKEDEQQQSRLEKLRRFRAFLYEKRNRFFDDQLHKNSTRLLEYLQLHGVTDVYTSRNLANLKNNGQCQMRKQSKQNFIQIPLIKFVDYLQYKSADYSIRVHDIDEAYTSKTSSVSGNILQVQQKAKSNKPVLTNDFKGTRVKRGLFQDISLDGRRLLLNADLNAALNILKVGLCNNIFLAKKFLFKLCNPLKFKSDRDLVSFLLSNTNSDNTSLAMLRL